MSIFNIYRKYKKSFENPLSVMWNEYRRKELILVKLKDHKKRMFPLEWVWDYANTIMLFPGKGSKLREFYDSIQNLGNDKKDEKGSYIDFEYKNQKCKFYGVVENGKIINGDLVGTFFREDYMFLNLENSTVIDIGANIGDTAIYFCLNKAKHVIALEPFPFSYKYALFNATANNFNEKIELLNAGYGQDSEVNVEDRKVNGSSLLETSNSGIKTNIYSLRSLLNKYKLNDNILLKMDCEGCEYNLLKEPIDILRKFKRMEIEFHYGYKRLEYRLKEAGFSVHHSEPVNSIGSEPSLIKMAFNDNDLTFGIIYAERNSI